MTAETPGTSIKVQKSSNIQQQEGRSAIQLEYPQLCGAILWRDEG